MSSLEQTTEITTLIDNLAIEKLTPFDFLDFKAKVTIFLYTCSMIFGSFFNLVIIRAFLRNKIPKNIILLNVCIADFLVCILSCPASIIILMQNDTWRLGIIACKVFHFLQSIPTVTTTMLLMMLSIDRYLTVRRPNFMLSLNGEDRILPKVMVVSSWIVGIVLCLPIPIVRGVDGFVCTEMWISPNLKTSYVLCYIMLLYILPMAVVAKCHLSVGSGIFEAMANGHVPLPMPIQARNHELIIVASVNEMNQNNMANTPDAPVGCFERLFRTKKNRQRTATTVPANSLIKVRRKMAKMLVVMALIFALCWFPFVSTRLYLEFAENPDRLLIEKFFPFSLFLGHFHSVINPLVYWCLNRQSIPLDFSFRSLLPWNWGDKRHNWFRKMAQYWAGNDEDHYSRSSTTNEAQLGVFHPRFTRPRRKDAEDQV